MCWKKEEEVKKKRKNGHKMKENEGGLGKRWRTEGREDEKEKIRRRIGGRGRKDGGENMI
jgi:hypothetical protein